MFNHVCDICEKKLGFINFNIKDGCICSECIRLCDKSFQKTINRYSIEEVKSHLRNKSNLKYEGIEFTPSKIIGKVIEIDELRRLILLLDDSFGRKILDFDKVLDFDVYEDGDSLTSGGLAQALVGGLAFGGIGAIVGAVSGKKRTKSIVTQLKLRITVNDINNPLISIKIIDEEVRRDSEKYKQSLNIIEEATASFAVIMNKSKNNEQTYNGNFCHACGIKLIEKSNYCHSCGIKV